MNDTTGLADRENYKVFSETWRSVVLEEAGKWCSLPEARDILTEAVLSEFRKNYAKKDPPNNPGFYLRGQVCLIYSITGQNIGKLKDYIAEHGFTDYPETVAATEDRKQKTLAEPAEPEPLPQEEIPAEESSLKNNPVDLAEKPSPENNPSDSAEEPAPEQKSESPVQKAESKPDTFFDPVRTTPWTPGSSNEFHVMQEVELPDEEEEERSTGLSFLNTILFLLTAASFIFCIYESGLIQHLLQ